MNDLISRQAVLMSLADYQLQESPNWGANGMGNTDAYEAITECIRVIEQAPTIDPVRHGRWISVGHKRDRICSICDCDEPYKFADEDANVFDYCPHCGARMDGAE